MHKFFNKFIFLGLLSLLTLASWWAHNASLFSPQNANISKGAPKFFLSEVIATRFDSEGYEKSVLKVDSIINPTSKELSLVRPHLIFQESSSSKFIVTADTGITEDNETINLMGNVTLQVVNHLDSPNTNIATTFAIVNIPAETVKTEHKATVTRNSLVGFSDGFIYDAEIGSLNLLSEVNLTYDD